MDLLFIPVYMTLLYGIDRFIKIDSARWFVLHVVSNLLVIVFSFNDMFNLLINPLYISDNPSLYPRVFTIGLHLYHVVAFKKIEFIDYLHHFLMIGALSTTYYYSDLNLTNYFLFYMTGLTGMIDYFMLTLIKVNMLDKIVEKSINSKLNNYIRYPLIMNGISAMYFRYINNIYQTHFAGIFLLMCVFFWNGSYFNYRVIHNYGQNDNKKNTAVAITSNDLENSID